MAIGNVEVEVAEVLLAHAFKEVVNEGAGIFLHQSHQVLIVAAALLHQRKYARIVGAGFLAEILHLLGSGEGHHVGRTDRIFDGKAAHILGCCLCRNLRQIVLANGRRDVHLAEVNAGSLAVERNHRVFVFAHREFHEAIVCSVRSPCHHVAQAGCDGRLAALVGAGGLYGVELSVVVKFEFEVSVGNGIAFFVHHLYDGLLNGGVVACNVNLCVARSAAHHILRSVVAAKHFGVHQHTARCRLVEPAQVENGFGLAGAQEVPFAINPCLHPSVVVVGMSPARRVDLTGGNADGAQGGHSKG